MRKIPDVAPQLTSPTGRKLSEPNLQNFPMRTPEGRRIIAAFKDPQHPASSKAKQ